MTVRFVALCLLMVLGFAAPASAHENARTPIVHKIDHLRRTTNTLRRESGLRPIRSDLRYRTVPDRDLRLSALRFWQKRFHQAWRGSVWVELAQCESNGNWHLDTDFDGGLQFHPGTWSTYRLHGYPRYAYQASPLEQVNVARRVLRAEGWGAWPACSTRLGLR